VLNEGGAAEKSSRPGAPERNPFTPTFHFALEEYDGTGVPYIRIERLARLAAAMWGASVDDSWAVDFMPNEAAVQALNCQATRKTLGWRPLVALEPGLMRMEAWHDARANRTARTKILHDEMFSLLTSLAVGEPEPGRTPECPPAECVPALNLAGLNTPCD